MFKYVYSVSYRIERPGKVGSKGIRECISYIVSLEFSKPLKRGSEEFKKAHMLLTKAHSINPAMISIEEWVLKKRKFVPIEWVKGKLKESLAMFASGGVR